MGGRHRDRQGEGLSEQAVPRRPREPSSAGRDLRNDARTMTIWTVVLKVPDGGIHIEEVEAEETGEATISWTVGWALVNASHAGSPGPDRQKQR